MNPYTYQRPKITPLPNETGLTVPGGTGVAVVPNGTPPALKQPYLPGQYTEYPAAVQGWAQQALPGWGSGIESGRKADFYVTSSGDVVPATGYRYMDSGRANDAIISGEQYTTYIGFKKYDSAPQVKDAFQIADSWSDCKVRGEFDTLQVIDDLYVPTTKGNTTAIPEPITFSYPEYGKGGEHQLRVDKGIKFTNVDFIGDYKNE